METQLMRIYKERGEIIEALLKELQESEKCEDWGNLASVRRRPMLTTVIYYIQTSMGYTRGVRLEEIESFLYCMYLAECKRRGGVLKSITWCPIEQTLEEIPRRVLRRTGKGRYLVIPKGIIKKDGKPPYWNVLELPLKMAEKICADIISPPNESVRELLSKPPELLSKSPEMRKYVRNLEKSITLQRPHKGGTPRENCPAEKIRNFVTPEGVEIREFLGAGFPESCINDLEKAYEKAWQLEKLVYADGYLRLLTSIAEYYAKKAEFYESVQGEEWLSVLEKILRFPNPYRKLAAEYYIKAADVATSVSLIHFPYQERPGEAERYLKLAVELEERVMDLGMTPEYYSIVLNNLGTHYYETYRPEKALKFLKKALKYAKDPGEISLINHNLALTYADLGMKKKAVEHMVKSICIHYSTNHELGSLSSYDDDIRRISEMINDTNTDMYALKIALDMVGGNITPDMGVEFLRQIDRNRWPLTHALLSALENGKIDINGYPECTKLIQDIIDLTKAQSKVGHSE